MAATALGATSLTPTQAVPRVPTVGRLVPAHPGAALRRHADESSLNWAGYAVLPPAKHKITAVNSTFTVPQVYDLTPGFAATWTGIGGHDTSDLIQAGVSEDYGSDYYAWFELLPNAETIITAGCTGDPKCTVAPGDTFTVNITEQASAPGNWTISLDNQGKWTWSTTVAYTSTYSSAEWIHEAPSLGPAQTVLPLMDNASFGSGNTYTLDGGTTANTIAAGSPRSISMVDGVVIAEALPSALGPDGSSFLVCDYASTCP
jgi:hypothetical protein